MTGYGDTWQQVAATRLGSPLPLPHGKKFPPPAGYTGSKGAAPSVEQMQDWANLNPNANIALRLSPEVVGIDVDSYDDKHGDETLAELEDWYGTLPATWMTTSRDNGSGIRLYRVEGGTDRMKDAGPGIDTIRSGHRYAVIAPSVHPNGGVYRWIGPDGQPSDAPDLDDLPHLPARWVDYLRGVQAKPATEQRPSTPKTRIDRSSGITLRRLT